MMRAIAGGRAGSSGGPRRSSPGDDDSYDESQFVVLILSFYPP